MTVKTAIYNRIFKNWKKLKSWAIQGNYEAYRLYDRDIPEYPFIVDRYREFFVIYQRFHEAEEEKQLAHQEQIIEVLIELFGATSDQIFIKTRKKQSGICQYEADELEQANDFTVKESKAVFKVELAKRIDTGLFLDHRPLRQWIFKEAKDKHFLNLFSYTCSVSVQATLGGARTTTNVDLSKTYLNWGTQNYRLNQIYLGKANQHRFIHQDCFEYVRETKEKKKDKYDLIFIDPPSFSNSKRMKGHFDVQRDHRKLILMAMDILHPGGTLYFSCNLRQFKIDSSLLGQFNLKDLSLKSIPIDFRDKKIHQLFKITAK